MEILFGGLPRCKYLAGIMVIRNIRMLVGGDVTAGRSHD